MTPSLEGWPAKAKEGPSPHEVRLGPTGHQPIILMPRGNNVPLMSNLSSILMNNLDTPHIIGIY